MDLKYVVKIGFEPGAVLEDFILVAGDLEALFAFFEPDEGNVGKAYYIGGLRDQVSGLPWKRKKGGSAPD